MKKNSLFIVLMTMLLSCFNSNSSGLDLSVLGFYHDPDAIITALKDSPRGYRENFMLGMAYREKKELKKAIYFLSNSCFVSSRSPNLRLFAQPVYFFVKGFHRKSEFYNDAVAGIADMFFLYREFDYVIKLTGLVGDDDRALFRDSVLLRSRALVDLKRYDEALKNLSDLQKKYKDPDSTALIAIRTAGVYEKMENHEAAVRQYLKILSLECAVWHRSIASRRTLDITKKIGIRLSDDDSLVLAEGLYHSCDYRECSGLLSGVLGETKDHSRGVKAEKLLLRCLVREGKNAEALKRASKHENKTEMEKTVEEELWTAGRKRVSLLIYQKLANGTEDAIALESLERLALYSAENRNGGNNQLFERYIKQCPDGPYREYFLWRMGRNELRAKNPAGALDHFSRGMKEDADGAYADAMRFWSWKILSELGKKDEARKLAMELVAFHPDSTYTWTLLGKIKDDYKNAELARIFEKAVSDRDRASYLFAHLVLYTKDGDMKGRLKRIEAMPGAELSPYKNFDKTISAMEVSSSNRQLCKSLEKYFLVGYGEAITRELSLVSNDDRGRKDSSIALAHWGRKYHHYYHALYSSLDLMRQEKLKVNLGLMSADNIAHLFCDFITVFYILNLLRRWLFFSKHTFWNHKILDKNCLV